MRKPPTRGPARPLAAGSGAGAALRTAAVGNRLVSVDLDPTTVSSGGDVVANVRYESVDEGTLVIEASAGFRVQPGSATLPAAARTQPVALRVARGGGGKTCALTFSFFSDELQKWLEVT